MHQTVTITTSYHKYNKKIHVSFSLVLFSDPAIKNDLLHKSTRLSIGVLFCAHTSATRSPLKYAWPSFHKSGKPSINSSESSSTNSTRCGTALTPFTETKRKLKAQTVAGLLIQRSDRRDTKRTAPLWK